MQLLGHFGGANNTQNTVLALFEPGAKGISKDSFPSEESMYFGIRPGRRRVFIPDMATISTEEATELVRAWRMAETGDPDPDPTIIERMVWEYQNVTDGEGLAKLMHDLAAKHPLKDGWDESPPVMPVFPDITQALNIAACDTRGVIVSVLPTDAADDGMEQRLRRLLFEEGIAGRTHMAAVTPEEWAQARAAEQVKGGELAAGVFFVAPDPHGLFGTVWGEVGHDASLEDMRGELTKVLERFRAEWRKEDRATHMLRALEQGLTWSEYDPDAGGIVKIGEGSKKLGEPVGTKPAAAPEKKDAPEADGESAESGEDDARTDDAEKAGS